MVLLIGCKQGKEHNAFATSQAKAVHTSDLYQVNEHCLWQYEFYFEAVELTSAMTIVVCTCAVLYRL